MKLFVLCVTLLSLFSYKGNTNLPSPATKREVATCYGYSPCNACSNCSRCRWCNAGGTCGVCARPARKTPVYRSTLPAATGQCRAITKKGTRCSRRARTNGYCWQHGG